LSPAELAIEWPKEAAQPGRAGIPACWFWRLSSRQFNTGQESPVNPQTRMSALLSRRTANPSVLLFLQSRRVTYL